MSEVHDYYHHDSSAVLLLIWQKLPLVVRRGDGGGGATVVRVHFLFAVDSHSHCAAAPSSSRGKNGRDVQLNLRTEEK